MNSLLIQAQEQMRAANEKRETMQREKSNIVNYEPQENGYYSTQTMYIISKIIDNNNAIEINDNTNTYTFTNAKGIEKKHIINKKAYQDSKLVYSDLAKAGYKQVCNIISFSEEKIEIIQNTCEGKVLTTIDKNGTHSVPYITEHKQVNFNDI